MVPTKPRTVGLGGEANFVYYREGLAALVQRAPRDQAQQPTAAPPPTGGHERLRPDTTRSLTVKAAARRYAMASGQP